ncbi:MAG: hypothetical protein Fur005_46930 [Roseiflexaceae bacterium]
MKTTWLLIALVLVFGSIIALPAASAAPIPLENPRVSHAGLAVSSTDFQISPDGSRVVYRAFGSDSNRRRLYSAPTDGSSAPILLSSNPLAPTDTVDSFQITPDGRDVIFTYGSIITENYDLYRVAIDGGDPELLNGPLISAGGVVGFQISPDSNWVVYRADASVDESFDLYRVSLANGSILKLNSDLIAGGSIAEDFAFTPDGARVIYRANQRTLNSIELYAVRIDQTGSTLLNDDLVFGGDVAAFAITPNSQYVLYSATQDSLNLRELYRVPTNKIGITISAESAELSGSVKLSLPLAFNGSVKRFVISPDGNRVVYLADVEQFNRNELFSRPIVGGSNTKLNGDLVAGGGIQSDYRISPNSDWVVYRADQQTNDLIELYATPISGGAFIKINSTMAGDVRSFEISSDSNRVVYLADQEIVDLREIYSRTLPQVSDDAPVVSPLLLAVKLNDPTDGSGVQRYAISPDGRRVVYVANEIADASTRIASVPIAGGANLTLNTISAASLSINTFAISPDSSRVIYRADQQQDGIFELFASYEEAPIATISGPSSALPNGSAPISITLDRAPTLASVTVQVGALGGNAIADTDYTLAAQSVTIAPGETQATLNLHVLPNPDRTTPRTLTIILSGTSTSTIGTPGSIEITLANSQYLVALPVVIR